MSYKGINSFYHAPESSDFWLPGLFPPVFICISLNKKLILIFISNDPWLVYSGTWRFSLKFSQTLYSTRAVVSQFRVKLRIRYCKSCNKCNYLRNFVACPEVRIAFFFPLLVQGFVSYRIGGYFKSWSNS